MQQVSQENEKKENSITYVPINQLLISQRNPRKITKEQFEKLCVSLSTDPDFLQLRPVLVNRVGNELHVYAGNQRVRAAKRLGWKQIACVIDDDLPSEVMKERALKDNVHVGTHDYDILANTYEIETLLAAGMTEAELQLDKIIMDDNNKETKKKPKICPNCGHEY